MLKLIKKFLKDHPAPQLIREHPKASDIQHYRSNLHSLLINKEIQLESFRSACLISQSIVLPLTLLLISITTTQTPYILHGLIHLLLFFGILFSMFWSYIGENRKYNVSFIQQCLIKLDEKKSIRVYHEYRHGIKVHDLNQSDMKLMHQFENWKTKAPYYKKIQLQKKLKLVENPHQLLSNRKIIEGIPYCTMLFWICLGICYYLLNFSKLWPYTNTIFMFTGCCTLTLLGVAHIMYYYPDFWKK